MTGISEVIIKLKGLPSLLAFVLFNSTVSTSEFRTSELQFNTASNVTMPTVIFTQISPEQCWEECTASVACRAFNFYNLQNLCELDIVWDLTNTSTNRPVFGKSGVLHWEKQEFPDTILCGSNTCNFGQRCDQDTGTCETKVVGGNINRVGSKVRLDCKGGFVPSFTKNIVECDDTGQWIKNDLTCEVKCESGWAKFQTSCYLLSNSKKSWNGAKGECEKDNAQLVSITSQEEYDFVHNENSRANVDSIWIGANDRKVRGSWTWISGEEWAYAHFAPGEPNRGRPGNCLVMRINKGWENDHGGKTKYFLCEKKV